MLILEIEQRKSKLITEQWNDPRWMLIEQKHIVPFVTRLEKYITEAELTPDQIKTLFTSIETQATSAGSNRTGVGKGIDAAKWIDQQIKKLGASLQSSGPVSNLDQKVEDLKRKIGAKDTKTVKIIQGVSDWAKANPKKASLAVGILTAAAAMAGGPLGGAVAGFLARATKDLLQGSKLSTAVGKSVKTAAIGAVFGAVTDMFDISKPEFEGGPSEVQANISSDDIQAAIQQGNAASETSLAEFLEVNGISEDVYKNQLAQETLDNSGGGPYAQEMIDKIKNAINIDGEYPQDFSTNISGHLVRGNLFLTDAEYQEFQNFLKTLPGDATKMLSPEAEQWLVDNVEGAAAQLEVVANQPNLSDEDVFAMTQNPQGSSISSPVETARYIPQKDGSWIDASTGQIADPAKLRAHQDAVRKFTTGSNESVVLTTAQVALLTEGIMDNIKGAASKVANKAKSAAGVMHKGVGAAQQVGKNITTKVTADKLMSAWKKAGSPTDSDKIAQVMRSAGVSDDVMAPVFKSMSIPFVKGAPRTVQPAVTNNKSAMDPITPKGSPASPAYKQVADIINKVTPEQAKELITYIDSLGKK